MNYYRIDEETLLDLIEDNLKLCALENGGVDNWCWYGDSINEFLKREFPEEYESDKDFDFRDAAEIDLLNVYGKYREIN